MKRRRGFTLVETLMVIVVVSLCALIAFPKFSQAITSSNLNSAKNKVTTMYGSARAAAGGGRTAFLHFDNNRLFATATPRTSAGAGTRDTVTPVENLFTQYGIAMTSTRDSIRIDPAGMGRDSAVIVLTKGSQTSTIRISQYGRILK